VPLPGHFFGYARVVVYPSSTVGEPPFEIHASHGWNEALLRHKRKLTNPLTKDNHACDEGPASQVDAGPSLILVGTAGFEPATP
jgi:hypothetical protein